MKITCESCNTRYSIPDEKVRGAGKTFKIRCKSCGEMMTVKGVGDSGDAGAVEDAVWYYAVGNDRRGPITREALAGLVQAGEVTAQTYVWQNGMANWSLLETVPELQDLLEGAGVEDAGEASEDGTDTAYMSQADLLAAQAAFGGEPSAPAGEATGGLFGDEAIPAGGVDDADDNPFAAAAAPAATAPAPAQAASGTAPAAADDDLFNFDVPSPNDDPSAVHQRRDSSVLFSLDDLGGSEKKGMSTDEALVTESSGLIDIRAVASATQRQSGKDNPFGDTAAAGLSQPSRANVAAVSVPIVQKKSSGSGPWIAVAAIVLVLGGGGVAWFLMNQNKSEPAPVAQQQVVAPAPTDPATATVAKADEPKPEEKKEPEAPPAEAKKDEPPAEAPPAADEKAEAAAAAAADAEPKAADADAARKDDDAEKEKARKEREKRQREARVNQPVETKKDEPKAAAVAPVDSKKNTKDVNNLLKNLQEAKPEQKVDTGSAEALPQRLAAPVVQKAVRSSNGKFLACYKKMPPVAGGVTIGTSFTIVSSGTVSSARVSNPGGTTPEVQGCIVAALKELTFPKFKDPQMVVNYPLRLQ